MNKTSDKEKLIILFYKKIDYYKNLADKDNSISDRLIRREIEISLLEILHEFIIDDLDYIPKSKVKEQIEELLEKGKQMSEKERQEETQFMQVKLKALEELLERW